MSSELIKGKKAWHLTNIPCLVPDNEYQRKATLNRTKATRNIMKDPIMHKRCQRKYAVEVYQGLGVCSYPIPPLCEGAHGLYRGRSFYTTRNWKDVTCKRCLKIKKMIDDKKELML